MTQPPTRPLAGDWLSKCATNLALLAQVGLGPFDPHAVRTCPIDAHEPEEGSGQSPPRRSATSSAPVDALAEMDAVIDAHTRLNLMAAVALTGTDEPSASPARGASYAPVDGGRAPTLRSEHRRRLERAATAATGAFSGVVAGCTGCCNQ